MNSPSLHKNVKHKRAVAAKIDYPIRKERSTSTRSHHLQIGGCYGSQSGF